MCTRRAHPDKSLGTRPDTHTRTHAHAQAPAGTGACCDLRAGIIREVRTAFWATEELLALLHPTAHASCLRPQAPQSACQTIPKSNFGASKASFGSFGKCQVHSGPEEVLALLPTAHASCLRPQAPQSACQTIPKSNFGASKASFGSFGKCQVHSGPEEVLALLPTAHASCLRPQTPQSACQTIPKSNFGASKAPFRIIREVPTAHASCLRPQAPQSACQTIPKSNFGASKASFGSFGKCQVHSGPEEVLALLPTAHASCLRPQTPQPACQTIPKSNFGASKAPFRIIREVPTAHASCLRPQAPQSARQTIPKSNFGASKAPFGSFGKCQLHSGPEEVLALLPTVHASCLRPQTPQPACQTIPKSNFGASKAPFRIIREVPTAHASCLRPQAPQSARQTIPKSSIGASKAPFGSFGKCQLHSGPEEVLALLPTAHASCLRPQTPQSACQTILKSNFGASKAPFPIIRKV